MPSPSTQNAEPGECGVQTVGGSLHRGFEEVAAAGRQV